MRLTVLGSSASYAGPGQACSGHLVEGGGAAVLLDCGNGVIANLARVVDPLRLDAVVITHGHPDHFLDLFALQALLRYAPSGPAEPLPLHLPSGLFERMLALHAGKGAQEMREAFVVHELAPGETIAICEMRITAVPMEHTDPTFGLRVRSDGRILAYTADSAADDSLLALAEGADLLLSEATLPEKYAGAAPHLTARQAGEYARKAGAGRLVLTHVWPTSDRDQMAREAAEPFGDSVTVASELDVFNL
jgi:ribonuclease BN (tRNA processing enzyme)